MSLPERRKLCRLQHCHTGKLFEGKKLRVEYVKTYSFIVLTNKRKHRSETHGIYDARPENKDTKILNMDKIFNLQKRHCE